MSDFTVTIRPKRTKLKIEIDLPYATLARWKCWMMLALIAFTLYGDNPR